MTQHSEKNMENKSDFELQLHDYINNMDQIIVKFGELRSVAEQHHFRCNVAKTAGTAMSGAGVITLVGSVLTAPVTGGVSLITGAGGAVMSVSGAISNVITDYVDYKISNNILSEIQNIAKSKEEFDESLRMQLENFGKIIQKLMDIGMDEESAIMTAVEGVARNCIDLTQEPNLKLMNALSAIIKLHHIEGAALEAMPIISHTMHISQEVSKFIYNIFGFTAQTGQHIFKIIGRVSSVVSIAFSVMDVALLVKDWKTNHPSIEVIDDAKEKLEEERKILVDFLEVLEATRDREGVMKNALKEIRDIEEQEEIKLLESYEIIEPEKA